MNNSSQYYRATPNVWLIEGEYCVVLIRRRFRQRMLGGAAIDIAFSTKAVRSLCQSGEAIEQKYGAEFARALIGRLADIRAATSIAELLSLLPVSTNDTTGAVTIYVHDVGGSCIKGSENHRRTPRLADKTVDWPNVTRIRISKVEVLG